MGGGVSELAMEFRDGEKHWDVIYIQRTKTGWTLY